VAKLRTSITLFNTVKSIANLNPQNSDKFEIN